MTSLHNGNGDARESHKLDGKNDSGRYERGTRRAALPRRKEPSGRTRIAENVQELETALREIAALRERHSLHRARIAELEQALANAHRFAYRDELTGLPNRRLLHDRVDKAISHCQRHQQRTALLFFDLNGFKEINDTYGHAAGDALLQQFAQRLAGCVRAADTACRYGGDEFVVLLTEIDSDRTAATVADKIRGRLAMPYEIDGRRIELSTSVGIAVYPVDGKEYHELLRESDRHMYRHKLNGTAPMQARARS